MKHTQRNLSQIDRVLNAWETGAPEATFGGMTLEQFKQLVKPATDSRSKVEALLAEAVLEKKQLVDNAKSGAAVAKRAVNGLLAHPDFGYDSPLYTVMGYVRQSDRKSGLTRKGEATAQNTETQKS